MKIAYVCHWDLRKSDGVTRKIINQIESWRSQGNEVKLFAASGNSDLPAGIRHLPNDIIESVSATGHFRNTALMVKRIVSWDPEAVYLRYSSYYPGLTFLMKKIPTFLEINTLDVPEYKIRQPLPLFLYHLATRNRLLNRARGMCFVTNEIAHHFKNYDKPFIVISNGVISRNHPILETSKNKQPRLLYIGSRHTPWQGIEKILILARAFPDWHFDIIGPCPAQIREELTQNVRLHGYLNYKDYKVYLEMADIGIGTLSLYRKGMDEACPLKVREYLLHGIPSIIGYRDTDFPTGAPFILTLPNVPSNVRDNLFLIREFVEKWKGKKVLRDKVAHLDFHKKELARLSFIEEQLSSLG